MFLFFCFCHWFSKKISSFEAISLRKIREHPEGGASLGRKKKNFEKPTRLEGRLEGRREQRLGHSRSRADDPASTQGQCLRANSDHHRPSIKEESSRRPPEGLIKDVSDERISLSLSLSLSLLIRKWTRFKGQLEGKNRGLRNCRCESIRHRWPCGRFTSNFDDVQRLGGGGWGKCDVRFVRLVDAAK